MGVQYRGGIPNSKIQIPSKGKYIILYHEEGRATLQASGTFRYEYCLKDHLGNTHVVFTDDDGDGTPEIIQEADYYPFGMRHDRGVTATNHYLYNGGSTQYRLGLGLV